MSSSTRAKTQTTSRPTIGITTGPDDKDLGFAVVPLQSAPTHFVQAVWEAGGLPVLVPTAAIPEGAAAGYLGVLDGLILTGGGDVDPANYGEPRHELSTRIAAERDTLEMGLTRRALASGIPVLGVCRGMQILNVTRGGSLHQDLMAAGREDHQLNRPGGGGSHVVTVVPGSLLASAAGSGPIQVNSLHHQAVHRLGEDVRSVAVAPDGTVEAIEISCGSWALGIQWHPEWMFQTDPKQLGLFRAVVQHASGSAGGRGRRAAC